VFKYIPFTRNNRLPSKLPCPKKINEVRGTPMKRVADGFKDSVSNKARLPPITVDLFYT
jgi:hypothetical protein